MRNVADNEKADGAGAVDWDKVQDALKSYLDFAPGLCDAGGRINRICESAERRILQFAAAGKHRRVYVVRTTSFKVPNSFRIETYLFGYGSRNVAFKIAKEKNAHVQILEFRKDFWKDPKVESLLEALDFEEDAQHNDHRHGAAI